MRPESNFTSEVWLEMKNPGPGDAGPYRCRGLNKFGEDSKTVDVKRKTYLHIFLLTPKHVQEQPDTIMFTIVFTN